MIVVLDNYDSFVGNVARYLLELGEEVSVLRNNAVDLDDLAGLDMEALVVSPGPCGPREAGVSTDAVRLFSGRLPILGICLGHQCIGAAFGAAIVPTREPMHGRSSLITHGGTGLFAGLPDPLTVGRYHSLAVNVLPATPLRVTAWTNGGDVMAIEHVEHPTFGVQFHPESVLTERGYQIFANFLSHLPGRDGRRMTAPLSPF
ncbi:aminodeoxychorismate/anthranilate synthase component II [Pleomorphomonas diazotrophica]|uniref:Aminodeoxychorismate/anthranilate synthase component II n=1 Tax=Pleomorphomonas diazotrophica TaxID=1166257 RepID=A0A1I4QM75_9HYPH|nr:aminodeoxychorismate/anthranilate synthase component II [Pleomorphomonas diazotrophica]PKR90563.1 aminodeoxychorismate/anthranilate synthase component II [Pleomorphomonas diazotrophica]SFM41188.1 anthranilate synthase component 2/para-aminobenzoate synthetase component 2 [Pleomorphomonas diazotrophica]